MSRRRDLLGRCDIASGVVIEKLHCGLKLCRDTVLMSRHGLAFWGRNTIFGVATRPGHGREALCRDRAGLVSRQGAHSRRSVGMIRHHGARQCAVCASNARACYNALFGVLCMDTVHKHCSRGFQKKKSIK